MGNQSRDPGGLRSAGPCYVRLGRLAVDDVYDPSYLFQAGRGVVLKKGGKTAVLCTD